MRCRTGKQASRYCNYQRQRKKHGKTFGAVDGMAAK
jgi:hypothetical protein